MSIQNRKTLEAYQKAAKNYLNNNKKIKNKYLKSLERSKKEQKKFIKEVFKEIPKGSKILEVGSADGENAKYIQSLGYNIIASDIADDFLKAIKKEGLNPIKFNLLEDTFETKYKVIFCWRVFVHFTKKDAIKALNKSYEALEENGLLILNIINRKCKTVDSEWVDFPDEYHIGIERYFKYYSKAEFDEIVSKTKFKIKKFQNTIAENNINWMIYVLSK